VDDEAFIRMVLTDVFSEYGFWVHEASSAPEAMATLTRLAYCIDVLLTDIKMPGDPDGLGLAAWAREHCPEAKVVITTGYAGEPGLTPHAYDAFIRKPFDPTKVVGLVHRLIAGRS
jgi:CheY-like chemotaxis protein